MTAVMLLACSSMARAQIIAPAIDPEDPEKNIMAAGVSVGTPYLRDAVFWGLSADYTRVIASRWSASFALTYDQEHDRPANRPSKTVNTFTAVGTVNYVLSRLLTLTTGLGKGFLDDDNRDREMRFTSGDLGTGLALGINLPDLLGLSVAWEWNITQKEPTVSVDLTFGWSF